MSEMVEIKVVGLKQFSRDLKALDKDLPKAVRLALNKSVDVVVTPAKARVPKRSGRAAGTIKAKSTRTSARISAGGRRAPYYPWLDFGGAVGRKNSVERQFRKRGRYLYLAYFEQRDSGAFERALQDALLEVAAQTGIEVTP